MKYYDEYGRLLPTLFNSSGTYNAAGTAELVTAPGAGLHIYLTDVVISAAHYGSISLIENVSGGVLTGTYLISDIWHGSGMAGVTSINLRTPIKLGENVNLGKYNAGIVDHSVLVSGYIAE